MFSVYLYSFLLLNCVPPVINKLIKKPIKNLLNKGQMNRSKNVLFDIHNRHIVSPYANTRESVGDNYQIGW